MDLEANLIPLSVCEVCWLLDHVKWEPESIDETGNVLMRLVGVDVPQKVNSGEVDICCMCGGLTISGIYEFKDPKKVYFLESYDNLEFEAELNCIEFDGDE
jgi:hypothetical protein